MSKGHRLASIVALAAGTAASARADVTPLAGMVRYPDVGKSQIVFVYAGDLWLVPRAGGVATRLASPPGQEAFPRFSPDEKTIAFSGNYDGNRDIYTIPVEGGTATRVTYHPSAEVVCDWTPAGELLYSMSGLGGLRRQSQLFVVAASGGLPTQLPVPYGANGAISAVDAAGTQWLAYTPHSTDTRTWKRYRGGMATDVWLFNLKDKSSKRMTDWEGTDSIPMWFKDSVYYLSDQGEDHKLNIWAYDTKTSQRRQVTRFKDFDAKWPSMGPGPSGRGEIILQNGASIFLVDLANGASRPVDITIPGDRPALRPRPVNVEGAVSGMSISPSAKRVAAEARGDIWSLPAENGTPRNMTRTSGVAERDPSWSPDGRWIAFFSDASGEYELCVMPSDGTGGLQHLTTAGDTPTAYRYSPTWSPDSKHIVFTDKSGAIYVHSPGALGDDGAFARGTTKLLDTEPWGNPPTVSWSHDSKWITYAKQEDRSGQSAIWVCNVAEAKPTRITSGFFDDYSPTFDRKGDYLFFAGRRTFNPTYSDLDTTFIYTNASVLAAVPLRADIASPWAPKSDEEDWRKLAKADKKDEKKDDKGDAKDDKKDDAKPADDGVSGSWDGMATGGAPLPPEGVAFTLSIRMAKDLSVRGNLAAAIYSGPIENGKYDLATKTLTFALTTPGGQAAFSLTIDGSAMKGSVTVGDQSFTISGKRTSVGAGGDDKAKDGEKKTDDKKDGDKKDLVIDFEGIEARTMQLPVPSGRFGRLAVNDKNQLIYSRQGGPGQEGGIKLFDLADEKKEEKNVAAGGAFELSADGKKIIILRGSGAAIQDASAGASGKPVITAGMVASIDPKAEWKQMFVDAWRIQRDFFYVANMHGIDWPAMREQYGKLVEDCASRDDLAFVISEMISELNVGHAYYRGGDIESGPSVSVGMLGCDFELVPGDEGKPAAYRISKVYRGAAWDADARGPLLAPGVKIKEGDFLLAVNGVPLDPTKDPWAAFQGMASKTVTLTVNDTPTLERPKNEKKDDTADAKKEEKDPEAARRERLKPPSGLRDVVVQTLASEDELRFRAWIEAKRQYVASKSDGKVGYLYVPDTGIDGQNNLFRQFYGHIGKSALIVDERWNGGGQIPTRFIELLNRPITNYWARRDGNDWPWPPDSFQGPKCMLINGLAGSGGDAFPSYFKQAGLGKLIGMRTWGGLVGISGNPGLIDGGSVTVPTFGFYKKDGNWGIEGHGVDPDIEVVDDPALMQDYKSGGGDPQLDAAIKLMLEQVQAAPYTPPSRPADPDRKGMGLPEKDR
ncbi:MAG: PDZ domain-containing protein [Phycisphaerales bacterium]